MNWLEDLVEYVSPNALMAAGVIVLTPILLPIVGRGLRPLAKGAIKGYLSLQDKVKEVAASSTEQLSDLVAEAKAEHAAAMATVGLAGAEATSGAKERKAQSSVSGKEKTA